jgi:formylglycine-generating enzyme required for sulfatase activity
VNLAGTTCVWIDRTEVTVENYQEWLAFLGGRAPDWAALGGEGQCTWKQGGPSNPAGDASDECRRGIEAQTERHEEGAFEPKKPIRCVDWCDARAYCAWAGKRLCFGVNNSGVLLPRGKPPEWDRACSVGSTREYPYGTAYDHAACNVDQTHEGCVAANGGNTLCGPTAVDQLPRCKASASAPSDLSGNVQEWVDVCASGGSDGGADALCNRRGGSYLDIASSAACIAISPTSRRDRDPTTGFRCCADLTPAEATEVQTNGPR